MPHGWSRRIVVHGCALLVTMFIGLGLSSSKAAAQNLPEQILYNFCSQVALNGGCLDGEGPLGNLLIDGAGNLYGVTLQGGATATGGSTGDGSVFKLTRTGTTWTRTTIYDFCTVGICDTQPYAGLNIDAAGNLYGTASAGGGTTMANVTHGSVYKLAPNGAGGYSKTTLYSFCQNLQSNVCLDGATPQAPVIPDSNGVLYGTTTSGGSNNQGAVFTLTPNGMGGYSYAKIYDFCPQGGPPNCTDGSTPMAGLFRDGNGNLFGTTSHGGTPSNQQGTVFELSPNGMGGYTFSVLYTFCSQTNCLDGATPVAGLVMDGSGNLYGTTEFGGGNLGQGQAGVIFKLAPNGQGGYAYSVLYYFGQQANATDGQAPKAGLILDGAGNLYGTTVEGGAGTNGGGSTGAGGVVFRLSPDGTYTVLYNFCSLGPADVCNDGQFPGDSAGTGVVMDTAGNLYGMTQFGGNQTSVSNIGGGTVFKLQPGFNLVFQNSSGPLWQWQISGNQISGNGGLPTPNAGWNVVGSGDFDGDGVSDDLVFQNHNTGALWLWEMNGNQILAGGSLALPTPNPGWNVVAVADLDGDGTPDLVFQNGGALWLWEMSGTQIKAGGSLPLPSPNPGWNVVGATDFNGDGMADLVFENSNTMALWLWEMNGNQIIANGSMALPTPAAGWNLEVVGGNGGLQPDLVFQNNASGALWLWQMSGTQITAIGSTSLPTPAAGWLARAP